MWLKRSGFLTAPHLSSFKLLVASKESHHHWIAMTIYYSIDNLMQVEPKPKVEPFDVFVHQAGQDLPA